MAVKRLVNRALGNRALAGVLSALGSLMPLSADVLLGSGAVTLVFAADSAEARNRGGGGGGGEQHRNREHEAQQGGSPGGSGAGNQSGRSGGPDGADKRGPAAETAGSQAASGERPVEKRGEERERSEEESEERKSKGLDKHKPAEKAEKGKHHHEVHKPKRPPETVAEWLSDLLPNPTRTENDDKRSDDEPGSKTKHAVVTPEKSADKLDKKEKKPEPTPAAPAARPAPKTVVKKAGASGVPQFPVGTPEVLGVNMSQATYDRALKLGFKPNGRPPLSQLELAIVRLLAPPGMTAEAARDLLRADQPGPGESIEVNQTYRIWRTASGTARDTGPPAAATTMATACGTDRCYGASMMGWQPALATCSRGLGIGVIDTGYDATHPAFKDRKIKVPERSLAPPHASTKSTAKSPDWHGTGVLALLAGDARSGTSGLTPNAQFYMADAFSADADGQPIGDTVSVVQALNWLADPQKRVRIVNLSLAGPPDKVLERTLETMARKGTLFIAAAGNEGPTAQPVYPAAYDTVIAVTAVSADLKSYRYAGRGPHIDLAAPGVKIWTAAPGGQSAYHSGTSFAVPHATAVIASIYEGLGTKSKAGALAALTYVDLGQPGRDPIFGRGLLLAPKTCNPDEGPAAAPAVVTALAAQARR